MAVGTDRAGEEGRWGPLPSSAFRPRLLLLLLVLAGIAAMHTIGHPVDAGHSAMVHSEVTSHRGTSVADSGDHSAGSLKADDHDHGVVMNPMNVCVAVLVGGIVLLLGAATFWLRRSGAPEDHSTPVHRRVGRGPPEFVLFGLAIANLSVLRT